MAKVLLYSGPSRYNGDAIRCYLYSSRGNTKTGKVAGLVIVADGLDDFHAMLRLGRDLASCGQCKFRSVAAGGDGTCYTHFGTTPVALSGLMRSGLVLDPVPDIRSAVVEFLTYRKTGSPRYDALRSAVYGDAAAIPVHVWQDIAAACAMVGVPVLGYTHGADALGFDGVEHLRGSHMLSVDSVTDAPDGWRHFRVTAPGGRPATGEFACPASVERGYKLTCVECKACGTDGYARNARSVVIWDHSPRAARAARVALASLSIAS